MGIAVRDREEEDTRTYPSEIQARLGNVPRSEGRMSR